MFDLAVIGLVCIVIGIGIQTLPFGTCLRVVGPNGKAVHVRINDRGPYHGNRVLDLSRGAAKATGLYSSGVAVVRYKRVDPSHCE